MAYDEALARRIRSELDGESGLVEKKMFGGVGFMLNVNMAVGIHRLNNLMVRIKPEDHEVALAEPHVRLFEMNGKLMNGWIVVDSAGLEEQAALAGWVQQGATFAKSLPPK